MNKFKMDLNRKIEIFKIWFYWISGSNYFYWKFAKLQNEEIMREIDIGMYSFRDLHEIARSVLYELENLTCCYTYKETNFKDNRMSIEDDMCWQPDILTRSVCSKYLDNVKVIVENGINLENAYPHKELKSALHWAFYADNIKIFKCLIKNGCFLNENDIFYDPKYKKNFRFSILLYVLKNKSKFKNFDYFFENLKFDDFHFMYKQNIYEHLNEQDIVEMYEDMFEFGFNINEKLLVISHYKYIFHFYLSKGLNDFMYSQLFVCIYQNGIKPNLINYLVGKYASIYGMDAARNEIVQIISLSESTYHLNLYFYMEVELRTSNLIMILKILFPYLNRSSIIDLRQTLNKPFRNFANFHFMFYFNDTVSPLIENESNTKNYLFRRKYFQIFNILIKYCAFKETCFDDTLYFIYLATFDFHQEMDNQNFKKSLEFFVLYVLYFIENGILNTDYILNWVNNKIIDNSSISTDKQLFISKLVGLICEKYNKTPKRLIKLCRQKIRNTIQIITDEDINKLDLPKELNSYLKNTILLNENYFHSYYGYLVNCANELLK